MRRDPHRDPYFFSFAGDGAAGRGGGAGGGHADAADAGGDPAVTPTTVTRDRRDPVTAVTLACRDPRTVTVFF